MSRWHKKTGGRPTASQSQEVRCDRRAPQIFNPCKV